MIVSYVQPAMDAAIAGDWKDLKFKNNQDYPIYLDANTDNYTLTVTIYGKETRPANREVTYESEILSQTDWTNTYVADAGQPIGYISRIGSPHTGYEARLWKVVTVDGKEESREIVNTSTYKVSNATTYVGTASSEASASSAVSDAIATQDINLINAAIASNNDEAIAAAKEAAQKDKDKKSSKKKDKKDSE